MTTFEELLSKTEKSLSSHKIKKTLKHKIQKCNECNERYAIYSFFSPFEQYLHSDYPSFTPFYENFQYSNPIKHDDTFIDNLINEMVKQYDKGNDRLYRVIMLFFEKF